MENNAQSLQQHCKKLIEDLLLARPQTLNALRNKTFLSLIESFETVPLPFELQQQWKQLQEDIEWNLPLTGHAQVETQWMKNFLTFYEALILMSAKPQRVEPKPDRALYNWKNILKYAIRNRRKIKFHYHQFSRLGDPYIYGLSPKGKPAIQLYQTGGKSSSGTLHRLKYFLLEEMKEVQLIDKPFTAEEEMEDYYEPDDSFFVEIFEQVNA